MGPHNARLIYHKSGISADRHFIPYTGKTAVCADIFYGDRRAFRPKLWSGRYRSMAAHRSHRCRTRDGPKFPQNWDTAARRDRDKIRHKGGNRPRAAPEPASRRDLTGFGPFAHQYRADIALNCRKMGAISNGHPSRVSFKIRAAPCSNQARTTRPERTNTDRVNARSEMVPTYSGKWFGRFATRVRTRPEPRSHQNRAAFG